MQFRRTASLATATMALALTAAVTGSPAGAAAAAAPWPLSLISPGDPYGSCDISGDGPGTNSPSAEDEPYAAADPRDPHHVISIYQQDRWSNGGARGLSSSYSTDGVHFTQTALPFTHCAPGGLAYQRASDGWVSFGPDGTAYSSALVFDATDTTGGVAAATSYDGGRSWTHVSNLIVDSDPAVTNDKNSVTADPVHAGTAYQVWDRIDQTSTSYDGPSYISITRDHGRTWSQARPFVDTSVVPYSQTIGNVIVADARTDTLYDFFQWITATDATGNTTKETHFAFVRSTDQGRSWSKPAPVVADTAVNEVDPNAPTDPAKSLRAGAGLPSAAIDPQTGELYLAYEGSDFSAGQYDSIELVHSTDGGASWSTPVRINQAPNAPAFTPSIAVDRHGTVAVSYYDLRYLTPGNTTTLPGAAWLLSFPRGQENAAVERQISPVFDWLRAPDAGGRFLGDYDALIADDGKFRPVMVTAGTDPNNSTDVYTGLFNPGTLRATSALAAPTATGAGALRHRVLR